MQQALYRKYRPETFDEVIGQEHIKKVLQGALENDKIAHAYLFAGTRGTGKTTMARIFARGVGSSEEDIYEIDAASNRGIDDIRELRDAVATLPFNSPYKVYIIDEVHMLTKDAFNALLKTLEEPPKHVIFILATTELDKVLDTVVSRCQVFAFQKPTQQMLKEMVIRIAKEEGFTLEASSAELIALLGDGSFRDTQGILQKVLSFSKDEKISPDEVEKVTGAPSGQLVNDVITAVHEKNLENALGVLHKVVEQNIDIKVFLTLLTHKVRLVMLLRFAKNMTDDIKSEVADTDFAFLEKMSKEGKEINSQLLYKLLSVMDQTNLSHVRQLPLELMLIEILK
jgi:DNA polymerase-3 subunit gamma/tau